MAFGFVVERFGLFLEIVRRDEIKVFQRHISFYVGISFILLAVFVAIYSLWQHKRILKTINPVEIPVGYNLYIGMATNAVIGLLGVALIVYLFLDFF